MPKVIEIGNQPVTLKTIVAGGSVVGAIVTSAIACAVYATNVKSQVEAHGAQIVELRTRDEEKGKAIDGIERKLDVAVTILERIDKKTSRP
jgi:hypothetical protein